MWSVTAAVVAVLITGALTAGLYWATEVDDHQPQLASASSRAKQTR